MCKIAENQFFKTKKLTLQIVYFLMAKNSGAISVKEKIKCFLKPISPPQSEFILVSKKHEATRSITTPPPPPGWDACPSQGFPLHFIRLPWQFASTFLYSWGERGMVRLKCFVQEQTHWPSRVSNPDLWTRSPVHWPLCHRVLLIYKLIRKKHIPYQRDCTQPLVHLWWWALVAILMEKEQIQSLENWPWINTNWLTPKVTKMHTNTFNCH